MSCPQQLAFGNRWHRLLLFFGLTAFVFAACLPQANAAENRRQVTKISKSTIATKRKVSRTFAISKRKPVVRAEAVPLRPSYGQIAGLHGAHDALDLKSSVALVIDQETREVLFSKNDQAVLPIASLTKLKTGLVVSEAH